MWSSFNFIPSGSSKNTGTNLRSVYDDNIFFNILTPKGLPTYSKNNFNSTLDLTFGSGIFNDIIDVNPQLSLGSDHFPILYSFNFNSSSPLKVYPLTWNLNKINWNHWKNNLDDNITNR